MPTRSLVEEGLVNEDKLLGCQMKQLGNPVQP